MVAEMLVWVLGVMTAGEAMLWGVLRLTAPSQDEESKR